VATSDRARENGLRAYKTVEKVLTDIGWEPEPTGDEGVLRVDFSVDNIPVSEAFADVRIDYERFVYYLNFRDRAPSRHRQQTMEFVTMVNYDLVTGNFEFDLSNGSVRFKSSIDFTKVNLNQTLVRNIILSAKDVVEDYADALISVMRGKKSARQALKDAESGGESD
jgi:hypothetical protein